MWFQVCGDTAFPQVLHKAKLNPRSQRLNFDLGLGSWAREPSFWLAAPASGNWEYLPALVTHPLPTDVHTEYPSSMLERCPSRKRT